MKAIIRFFYLLCLTTILSCSNDISDGIYENHMDLSNFTKYDSNQLFFSFDKSFILKWKWTCDDWANFEGESYPIRCFYHKNHSDYITETTTSEPNGVYFDRQGKVAFFKWGVEELALGLEPEHITTEIQSPDGYLHTLELVNDYHNNMFNIIEDDNSTIKCVEYLLGLHNWSEKEVSQRKKEESWGKALGYINQMINHHEKEGWTDYLFQAERVNETDIKYIYVDGNGKYTHTVLEQCIQGDGKYRYNWKYSVVNDGRDINIGLNGDYKEKIKYGYKPFTRGLAYPHDDFNPQKPLWNEITTYHFNHAFKEDISVLRDIIVKSCQTVVDSTHIEYVKNRIVSKNDKFELFEGSSYFMDVHTSIVIDEGKVIKIEPVLGSASTNFYYKTTDKNKAKDNYVNRGPGEIPYHNNIEKIIKNIQFPVFHPKEEGKIHVFSFHTIIKSTMTRDLWDSYVHSERNPL